MPTTVDVILPIYWRNIDHIGPSVEKLVTYFRLHLRDYSWRIVLSVNGGNADQIIQKCKELSRHYKNVTHVYTPRGGKGEGVFYGWEQSTADIRAYMDVDLATDLRSFRPLIQAIKEGHDISIGSRYHPESNIRRDFFRLFLSRVYLLLFYQFFLGVPCRDSQCGFKAVNARVVKELLPLVKDRGFFFESELLYLAYKKGYRIKEVPITWSEGGFSSVNMVKTVPHFIKSVWRLKTSPLP